MTPDEFTNQEFFLEVGDGHRLYVQDWGRADAAVPILFLHGGPGAGCNDRHKALFDPKRQRVIFHDQRGAGRSTPFGALKHNTTADLVEDIERIADHLQLQHYVVTGGSWGSCLALVYAIHHPRRIQALVLHGVFTGSTEERDWLFKGRFRDTFPEVWSEYIEHTPAKHRHDPTAYHLQQILTASPAAQKRSAYIYGNMEYALLRLDDRPRAASYEEYDPTTIILEAHYSAHQHWLPERFVLNNASKLKLPVYLVQGRYDMICPPAGAYKLHRSLPQSELIWTTAGHSGSDRANYDIVRTILSQLTGAP